jgi:AcrR family transcriptional regulator
MARISKNPEIRRQEILSAAQQLFNERGYAGTSVEAIIKTINIAKGTFYYYFKTKQAILEALVEQIADELFEYFETVVACDLSSIDKLAIMLRGEKKQAQVNQVAMKAIHLRENRELQESINVACIHKLAPLIVQVLHQGFEEKIFSKKITLESLQLILAGSQFLLDSGLFEWPYEQRKQLLSALQELLEFATGAKPNSLTFITQP